MLKKSSPTSAGVRHKIKVSLGITRSSPEKSLTEPQKKHSGRNAHGHITTRHRGGGVKRRYRLVDFRRNKKVDGRIISIEYDPGRSALIALVYFRDGDKRYILAPEGLKEGDIVQTGSDVEPRLGNTLPLRNIPVGMPIHNLELKKGKGGQIVRSAGTSALIQSKDGDQVTVRLPSGEIRLLSGDCFATIGQVSNLDHQNRKLGKAGTRRLLGWRPSVRGIAQHPDSHPHGGGEGRSGIGMPSPKSPWGKHTLGKKTRSKYRRSNKLIIKRRNEK